MYRWKYRRRKPWRRISRKTRKRSMRQAGAERGRKVRRLCLLLLAGEILWLTRNGEVFLASCREISGVVSEERRPSDWFGFGADLREGKIYIFRREEQVVK